MAGEHLPVFNYEDQTASQVVSKLKTLIATDQSPNLDAVAEYELENHSDRGTVLDFLAEQGVDVDAAKTRLERRGVLAAEDPAGETSGGSGQSESQPAPKAATGGNAAKGTSGRSSGSGGATSAGTGGATSAGTGGAKS
jgi:hypothetical protein